MTTRGAASGVTVMALLVWDVRRPTGDPSNFGGGWAYASADVIGSVKGNSIEFSFETLDGTWATYAGTIYGGAMDGMCDYGEVEGLGTCQATRRESFWGL